MSTRIIISIMLPLLILLFFIIRGWWRFLFPRISLVVLSSLQSSFFPRAIITNYTFNYLLKPYPMVISCSTNSLSSPISITFLPDYIKLQAERSLCSPIEISTNFLGVVVACTCETWANLLTLCATFSKKTDSVWWWS